MPKPIHCYHSREKAVGRSPRLKMRVVHQDQILRKRKPTWKNLKAAKSSRNIT
jgi:hypothetical protein